MKKIILDFSNLKNAEEIHEYLFQKMELPEYYGRNLDALYDCLSEIDTPTCIAIFNCKGKIFNNFLNVFRDSECENRNICCIIYTDSK